MEAVLNALLQLFVLSLLAERIVDVIHRVIGSKPLRPTQTPDWGVLGTVLSFVLGLVICHAYEFDLIKIVTGGQANQVVGTVLTALVLAGGSAGVRAIVEALRAIIKANRDEAEIRSLRADLQVAALASSPAGIRAWDEGVLPNLHYPRFSGPTPIGERSAIASRLHDDQGTYKRGCSEFVCAVLDVAYEQANELMGDDPKEITDWSKVASGAIVGWKSTSGSGHVSVYVNDGKSTYIDVREPASTNVPNPKPRRLNSYGNQKMYLGGRFGT